MTENMNDRTQDDTTPTTPLEPTPEPAETPATPVAESAETPATHAAPASADTDAEKAARITRTNRIALGVGGGVLAVALLLGSFGAGMTVGSHVGGDRGARAGHARGMEPRGDVQGRGFDGRGDDSGGRGGKGGRGGQGMDDGQRGQRGLGGQQGLPKGHPDTSAPSSGAPQSEGDGVFFMQ